MPSLASLNCPYCRASPAHSWSTRSSPRSLVWYRDISDTTPEALTPKKPACLRLYCLTELWRWSGIVAKCALEAGLGRQQGFQHRCPRRVVCAVFYIYCVSLLISEPPGQHHEHRLGLWSVARQRFLGFLLHTIAVGAHAMPRMLDAGLAAQ